MRTVPSVVLARRRGRSKVDQAKTVRSRLKAKGAWVSRLYVTRYRLRIAK